LPPVDDLVVQVDRLVCEPESWTVYLRGEPSFWTHSADRKDMRRPVMLAHAEDDLGGLYLSQYFGSPGLGGPEELTLTFRPRLNPLARTLTLTFTFAAEQVTIERQLP
jgi:hypothetical protein